MDWFSGNLGEAITLAQSQKKIFVAFVEGSCDDKSKVILSVLNEEEVRTALGGGSFICVKLEAASVGHRQLVEIYKHVLIPSLFFISHYGQPLDVVEGNLYEDSDLKKAILDAISYSRKKNILQNPPQNMPADRLLEERRQQVETIIDRKRKLKEKSEVKTTVEEGEGSVENTAAKSLEKELKKMAEERERERREEALARQRILDQIAQDKAERVEKMKMAAPKPATPKEKTEKPETPPTSSSSDARIQFRLPTGESKLNMFPVTTTLADIRKYIDNNLQLTYRDYRLATTFPRREFTAEDSESTLQELSLVPTAVLLILPKSGSVVSPGQGSLLRVLTEMVTDLLGPVYSLGRRLRGWFFPATTSSPPSGGGSSSSPSPPSSQRPPSASTSSQPQTSATSRSYVRKAGNIHSLRDLRDGNDENNTWNGNSTQQM